MKKKSVSLTVLDSKSQEAKSINFYFSCSEENANYLVHRAMVKQLNNKRQGTASTKTRSEVRGGGRKPWRQKGTGKARAGSNTSPIWRGGGTCFGPKTKSYSNKINKKEFRIALNNLLFNRSDEIVVISNFPKFTNKTKDFLQKLRDWNMNTKLKKLIILAEKNPSLILATRNIPYIDVIMANNLNVCSILNAKEIIVEELALDIINKAYEP